MSSVKIISSLPIISFSGGMGGFGPFCHHKGHYTLNFVYVYLSKSIKIPLEIISGSSQLSK